MTLRIVLLLLAGLPFSALAQRERPIPPAPAGANATASPRTIDTGDSRDDRTLGRTTRALLQAQVTGNYAGKRLPIPGDEASAAYRRYLRSFDHDIPEFFETRVQRSTDGGQ